MPIWVLICFFSAQYLIGGAIWLIQKVDSNVLSSINQTLFQLVASVAVYLVTILFIALVPWIVRKRRLSFSDFGLNVKLPQWSDIVIMFAGLIIYLVLLSIIMVVVTKLFPSIKVDQTQDIGFKHVNSQIEHIMAFVALVIIAPVAEEVIFRGYLFGKIKKYAPIWIAVILTSLTFGFVHGAWNLAIDTFTLSVVLCLLRQTTNSLWSPILLHMAKNGLAFYALFINPTIFAIMIK